MKFVILKEGIPQVVTNSIDECTIKCLQEGWSYCSVPYHEDQDIYSDLDTELLIMDESGDIMAAVEVEVSSQYDEFNEEFYAKIELIEINGFDLDRVNLTDELKRDIENNAETIKEKANEKL